MARESWSIVDFHSHHVPASHALTAQRSAAPGQQARWKRIGERLASPTALLEAIEEGDLSARVVNIPTALFAEPGETFQADLFRRVNDEVANLVEAHPRQLHGLASVDAFGGDAAAIELTRSVRELGLKGVFLESEKDGRLLDAPEARPTLAAAAELGVPVFAHPVNPKGLTEQMARYGHAGTLFARGTVNAAALIALVEGKVFEELPTLKVVVTNLAIGGLLIAQAFGSRSEGGNDARAVLRRHVYIDTMGFEPTFIRAAADILGVDHVLAGSDWPIVSDGPIAARLASALERAGFSDAEQRQIAGDNAHRLLGI